MNIIKSHINILFFAAILSISVLTGCKDKNENEVNPEPQIEVKRFTDGFNDYHGSFHNFGSVNIDATIWAYSPLGIDKITHQSIDGNGIESAEAELVAKKPTVNTLDPTVKVANNVEFTYGPIAIGFVGREIHYFRVYDVTGNFATYKIVFQN